MTATVAERADLHSLTDEELSAAFGEGEIDLDTLTAECDRRERAAKVRAASRERHAEWEAAAYANYLTADEATRGNLLSEAGKRTGRDPWPMLWEGREERARLLANDDLLMVWDYTAPRPPAPAEYAAGKREALAEQEVRHHAEQGTEPEPKPARKPRRPRRKAAERAGATVGAVREPEPPLAIPDLSTGSTSDHIAAITRFTGDLAERAERRRERMADILARCEARNGDRK